MLFGQNCAPPSPHSTRTSSKFPARADVPKPRSSRKLCRRASSSRTPIAAEGGGAEGSATAEGSASADEGGAAVGNGDGGGGATTPPPPTSVPRSCVHRDLILVQCQDPVTCQNPGTEGARAGDCLVELSIKHPCNPIPVCCCNSIAILLQGRAQISFKRYIPGIYQV
jgi:hypothetical protein